jgi:hypothetical protein
MFFSVLLSAKMHASREDFSLLLRAPSRLCGSRTLPHLTHLTSVAACRAVVFASLRLLMILSLFPPASLDAPEKMGYVVRGWTSFSIRAKFFPLAMRNSYSLRRFSQN